jgi:hypothetical protein
MNKFMVDVFIPLSMLFGLLYLTPLFITNTTSPCGALAVARTQSDPNIDPNGPALSLAHEMGGPMMTAITAQRYHTEYPQLYCVGEFWSVYLPDD